MIAPLLEFKSIGKAFFGVQVLKEITFAVGSNRTVGLVGENGAGKSTLMNILGGNLPPDSGRMLLNGGEYCPANPKAASKQGIAFIHQELNLFPNLSIAENLFLTSFPLMSATPFINRSQIRARSRQLLKQVGLDTSPDRPVETLSAGERQLVEIARALSADARLILFDEPTTSLSAREKVRLFELIGGLRARGIAMIYISHVLADVFRLCDDLVVLRDGAVVGTGPIATFDTEKLVSLMVGRTMNQMFPVRQRPPGHEPLLEARNICEPGVADGISLTVRQGEIVGIAGLMGAGRTEFARILFGLDPFASGEIRHKGESIQHPRPARMIERGIAFLTENRRSEGLCPDASVAENMTLAILSDRRRTPRWLRGDFLANRVAAVRDKVRLDRKTRESQPVRTLSGGNQQKVVLGKWLLCEPDVLILDEPTRGIDVGAKFEIYQLIHQLADKGAGVLLISSEIEELIGLCDRILVMRRGRIVDECLRKDFDPERILAAALGSNRQSGNS
jgi:ribose transport system ATP-binding protein